MNGLRGTVRLRLAMEELVVKEGCVTNISMRDRIMDNSPI